MSAAGSDVVRVKPPRVGSPIIFRAVQEGPDRVVRPCSRAHRNYWLQGYVVLSCSKCAKSFELLDQSDNTTLDDLQGVVDDGTVTEAEIRHALGWYSDFADAWAEIGDQS